MTENTRDKNAIDDYLLKLGGKVALPELPKIGYNYEVNIKGSIVSITEADRDDGGRIFTAKFEPVLVELIKESGEKIRGKDIRRRSQQLRAALFRVWRDNNEPKDFEDYYDEEMLKIIKLVIGN